MPETFGTGKILGSIGSLIVKIASSEAEITAAKNLRYQVFFENLKYNTGPDNGAFAKGIDEDRFDAYCDHLIVIDKNPASWAGATRDGLVVATYRLLGQEKIRFSGGFYSYSEFDLKPLLLRQKGLRFLEFGRSCVLPEYRSKRTLELLWHGSWAYVRKHGYDVMFGCASFSGTDPAEHSRSLAFLARHAAADEDWAVRGLEGRLELEQFGYAGMDEVGEKSALRSLPPLIKGYLRLGAMFSRDAVIDRSFNTIDVLVLLPVNRISPRYLAYYGINAERHAAA